MKTLFRFSVFINFAPILNLRMKKEEISQQQYERILECFMRSLLKNGLKGTTMDSVAASLQMSKRTLYEIFGSKEEMFLEVHSYYHKMTAEKLSEIFLSSSNVMEGIIKCFLFNRDLMSYISTDYIRDMQLLAKKAGDRLFPSNHKNHPQNLYDILQQGVKEGYFREDVNLMIQCRMLMIQMESLKRTEELFPSDISLLEIFDSIIMGFLRGISSEKGLLELEKFMPTLSSLSSLSSSSSAFQA